MPNNQERENTEPLNYWYDAQVKRYLMQFSRVFSHFQFQTGKNSSGENIFKTIPARLALQDRQAAHILKNNSENVMNTIPFITFHVRELQYVRERMQEPHHIDKVHIWEREYDPNTGQYSGNVGMAWTIERHMPVPFNLTIQVDIWTSNFEQKLQILEQLLILFNPSIELQHSENSFDWGALSVIELQNVIWSTRSIPLGIDNEIDIAQLEFVCPIWISPPGKLYKQKLIHQIVTNIGEIENMEELGFGEGAEIHWDERDLLARMITTPENHQIRVIGNEITLLNSAGNDIDEHGELYRWDELLSLYGRFRPNISQIRLKTASNIEDFDTDIVGTVDFHPTQANKLIWNIDPLTLPTNTLPAINAVINPYKTYPGNGLPVPVSGVRYLVLDEIGNNQIWGDIKAAANDIIQYDGTKWVTVWKAEQHLENYEYLLNLYANKQLKWIGDEWILAVEGQYNPGYWRYFV